ncbi:hypothetical protein [Chamaesiphon sp. VAR_69_metabat_338]|uniref:hypothetical protein n=1 Tax=Chamaesiphon sp. VAR_69_metabat_338 TaxID=2964704 RepID=UPI00286E8BC0|nr:hypothetical protein [Chamaesiphon sp. VAR_69_metabat_338]
MSNEPDGWIPEIDSALSKWSQGDCTIGGDCWFVTRFDPQRPLKPSSQDVAAADADADLAESAVSGFVVVTQTCDLVRSCLDRPFLEISPLVKVDAELLAEIKRLKRPSYAYIAGVADRFLVADLVREAWALPNRVMTVEKAVVARWERIPGCQSDADIRSLAEALARKRSRFAFPDDFNKFAQKLQKRMQDKHEKTTDEGEALRALREIRVSATPAWDADAVELIFWFIRAEEDDRFQNKEWYELLDSWLKFLPASGRFSSVDGSVVTLEDMTAKEYVNSDRLDLDRLSSN